MDYKKKLKIIKRSTFTDKEKMQMDKFILSINTMVNLLIHYNFLIIIQKEDLLMIR